MITPTKISYTDKTHFFNELAAELRAMYAQTWYTNLSSFSATVMLNFPKINWVGFYLNDSNQPEGTLQLGPFQGNPACLFIPPGKGVCGKAARERATQNIPDVNLISDHIACDAQTQSELVVPLILNSRLLGVLDIDSPNVARFDSQDQLGFENLAKDLVLNTQWPNNFNG